MSETLQTGKRICVVLLSGIGDVVHGLPVVNALKRDDPARQITWIVESKAAPLLTPHPAIDRVITFDRRKGLREISRLWRELRPLRFDLAMNLNVYFKSAIPTFIARAPDKLGFDRRRAADLIWMVTNHQLPFKQTPHTQDRFLEFLHHLGVEAEPIEWRIAITEEEREAQSDFFARLGGSRVAGIVMTSARPDKDWPTERFTELTGALQRDFGFEIVLLGGPGLREAARARTVAEDSTARLHWALGDDLRRLTYLVDGCDLLIAPDTGPVHIARALATPVIGLYGHTNPLAIGPYRAYEDLYIDRFNWEAPGQAADHEAPGRWGHRMELISVSDVLQRVELAVARYLSRRESE
jgi:heptosyltransferase I